MDAVWIRNFASDLQNHTASSVYTNPIDVATVIDLLELIVNLQAKSISVDVQTSEKGSKEFKKATVESLTQKKNKKNKTVAPKQKLQLGIFSRSTVRKIDYQ